tara:strand:- start:374 stop:934 length:561 start_codon:yes stop_codon:yes gene_type:complete
MKELNNKLAQVQTKLKAKKSSYNSFGKYYFRKSEDILEAVKPFLLELGVSVTVSEEIVESGWDSKLPPMLKSTANFSDGENTISATAVVGVDLNQKGMQTAQQFGAASTYGKKYALGNLFLIDDTEDADASNKHGKAAAVAAKPKPKISVEQFTKAKDYLKNGGKLEAIKTKYTLTSKQEEQLTAL